MVAAALLLSLLAQAEQAPARAPRPRRPPRQRRKPRPRRRPPRHRPRLVHDPDRVPAMFTGMHTADPGRTWCPMRSCRRRGPGCRRTRASWPCLATGHSFGDCTPHTAPHPSSWGMACPEVRKARIGHEEVDLVFVVLRQCPMDHALERVFLGVGHLRTRVAAPRRPRSRRRLRQGDASSIARSRSTSAARRNAGR